MLARMIYGAHGAQGDQLGELFPLPPSPLLRPFQAPTRLHRPMSYAGKHKRCSINALHKNITVACVFYFHLIIISFDFTIEI